MTNKEVFQKNLLKYMEKFGENQTALAKALGCTPAAVSLWCLGKKIPRVDRVSAIARHYDCKLSDLLGEDVVEEDEDTMVLFFRALSDEGKKKALSFVSFLLSEEAAARHAQEAKDVDR